MPKFRPQTGVAYIVAENQLQKAVQFSVTTMPTASMQFLCYRIRDGGSHFQVNRPCMAVMAEMREHLSGQQVHWLLVFMSLMCVNKAHCSSNSDPALHFMWDLLTVLSSSTQSSTIMFWVLEKPKVSPSLNQIHINPTNTV